MKVKMADSMSFYLCEHCSAVHIRMWRNGRLIAEAIPDDPDPIVAALQTTIAESKARQGITNTPSIAHKH